MQEPGYVAAARAARKKKIANALCEEQPQRCYDVRVAVRERGEELFSVERRGVDAFELEHLAHRIKDVETAALLYDEEARRG